jgi:hypothetical protein
LSEKQTIDELVQTYKRDYPKIMQQSSAYAFAIDELFGGVTRVNGGIFLYEGNGLDYFDESGPAKSWKISFDRDVDVKELFKSNGFDLEKMLDKNFEHWMELFKDEKFAGIASKVRKAAYFPKPETDEG